LDGQPLLHYGVSVYLNSEPDMVVCGEADSLPAAGTKIAECQPQLLVTELRLSAGDSLKLLKQLKAESRALRILVYSAFDESIFAERAIRAGVDGYVMKRAPREALAAAIRDIVKDGIYVQPRGGLERIQEIAPTAAEKYLRAEISWLSWRPIRSRDAYLPVGWLGTPHQGNRSVVGSQREDD
jgi:DNA-binding NarL/FixJ family response regulator